MVEEALKLAIEAQDHQRTLTGVSVSTPYLGQFPSSLSLIIYLETQEAVSLQFCSIILYQAYNLNYTLKYAFLKLSIGAI